MQPFKRNPLVDHQAEDERADDSVENTVVVGQGLGSAVDDRDLHRCFARGTGSESPQVWLGLNARTSDTPHG